MTGIQTKKKKFLQHCKRPASLIEYIRVFFESKTKRVLKVFTRAFKGLQSFLKCLVLRVSNARPPPPRVQMASRVSESQG